MKMKMELEVKYKLNNRVLFTISDIYHVGLKSFNQFWYAVSNYWHETGTRYNRFHRIPILRAEVNFKIWKGDTPVVKKLEIAYPTFSIDDVTTLAPVQNLKKEILEVLNDVAEDKVNAARNVEVSLFLKDKETSNRLFELYNVCKAYTQYDEFWSPIVEDNVSYLNDCRHDLLEILNGNKNVSLVVEAKDTLTGRKFAGELGIEPIYYDTSVFKFSIILSTFVKSFDKYVNEQKGDAE